MTDSNAQDEKSAHAYNSHMTADERAQLVFFVTGVGMYGAEVGGEGRKESRAKLEKFENGLMAYVTSLLAARDAEIGRLKARQITPDMEAVWNEYESAKTVYSRMSLISVSEGLRSDLWHAFVAMMEGQSE